MALVSLNDIKNWFKTNFIPTQQQFWDMFDSFRHKSDKVAATDVDGLNTLLAAKASNTVFQAHTTAENAHAAKFNEVREWVEDQLTGISGGFRGAIDLSSAAPTQSGYFIPKVDGTYANYGGLVATLSDGMTVFTYDGTNFGKQVVPIELGSYATKSQLSKAKLISFIGRDDMTDVANGDLIWDPANSRLLQEGSGVFTDYDENTIFKYENSTGVLLIQIVASALVVINEPDVPEIAFWQPGNPDVFINPKRFRDYYFDNVNQILFWRIDNWWDYETIEPGKLVQKEGVIYSKKANVAPLDIIAKISDIPPAFPVAWCNSDAFLKDFLNAITDLKVYGVPADNEIYFNTVIEDAGALIIEFGYTDMLETEGTVYNFSAYVPLSSIDLNANVVSKLFLNNGNASAISRAVISINWSKINPDLYYTNVKNIMRFNSSCIQGTYYDLADVVLPSVIPVVQNRQFRIDFENTVVNRANNVNTLLDNGFSILTSLSESFNNSLRYLTKTFTTTGDKKLIVRLLEGGKTLNSEISTVKVVAENAGAGVNLKVVVCGDSKTDNTTKLQRLTELFAADTMDITLLGTQDNGTFPNEGYSGRNVIDLTTSATLNGIANPFYNGGLGGTYKFDIAAFIATVGQTPDVVIIDHGANQSAIDFANVKAAYDSIIANITGYNSTHSTAIKIVFSIQEGASSIKHIDNTLRNGKYANYRLYREMLNEYDNRTAEKIYLLPQYLNVDCEWDFPYALVPRVNNFGSLEPRCTDDIHPGEQSFNNWSAGTYDLGSQVKYLGSNYVALKTTTIAPNDDKINWAKVVDGIGAGYFNISESYFCMLKYAATI